jgi:chitinase
MKRRLFLSGSAVTALGLVGCGGGGGGGAGAAEAATGAVADAATGVTATTAPAQALASAMPARVMSTCYATWDTGAYKLTDIPMDFNVINVFHAKPDGAPNGGSWNNVGNGAFMFEHYGEVPVSDIQACRSRGQKVLLTVGGAQAGFNFDTRSKSSNFVASYREMYERLGGFDGCEFNNFEANIGSSASELIWIGEQLKGLYGAGFAITAPPQPNSHEDLAMMKAMADSGVLTWASPQFYDWAGFNDIGFISNRMRDWVAALGADKVLVGLSSNYSNGPSLADCIREWDAVKSAHANIRGMFSWNAQLNMAGGNHWGSTMKARL